MDVPRIVPPSRAATTSQTLQSYATGQTGERAQLGSVPGLEGGNGDLAVANDAHSGQGISGKKALSIASKAQVDTGSEEERAARSDVAAFYRSLLDGFTQDESHADTTRMSGYWAPLGNCFTLCGPLRACGKSCLISESVERGLKWGRVEHGVWGI